MESGRTRRKTIGPVLAALGTTLLVACSTRERPAVEGVLVFDEDVALVRGDRIDSAHREFPVEGNATFVVMVVEDDTDVKLVLSHRGARGVAPATIEIDSSPEGEGIEIAVLDAPRGSQLTLSMECAQELDRPGKVEAQGRALRRRKCRQTYASLRDSPRFAHGRPPRVRAWPGTTSTRPRFATSIGRWSISKRRKEIPRWRPGDAWSAPISTIGNFPASTSHWRTHSVRSAASLRSAICETPRVPESCRVSYSSRSRLTRPRKIPAPRKPRYWRSRN